MENYPLQTDEPMHAKLRGESLKELPKDLYIPPEALRVFLEAFEGPLDLLLYLIKKENINILDIPMAQITRQYVDYINLMQVLHIELAAEYLVMAAFLTEIKSRCLLPPPALSNEESEQDPRAELVQKLQEYQQYQQAAGLLDQLPRVDRDLYKAQVDLARAPLPIQKKSIITPMELYCALQTVLDRAALFQAHRIIQESLSIRERMSHILSHLLPDQFTPFTTFCKRKEGSLGITVTLIAILELVRQSALDCLQAEAFSPIYLRQKGSNAE